MWKKEDVKSEASENSPGVSPGSRAAAGNPAREASPTVPVSLPLASKGSASISQGIRIKGEVTGSEDLFVDGQEEGKVNLSNGILTVGPNGEVKADIFAREVIVRGKIEGKVTGREKVQLSSTGQVLGEVQTERLAIEEGALLKGKVEAGKQPAKPNETKAAAAVATTKTSDTAALSSGTAAD